MLCDETPASAVLDVIGHRELVLLAKPGETERFFAEEPREGAVQNLLVARHQSIGFGAGAKPLRGDRAVVFVDVRIDGLGADDVDSVVESGGHAAVVRLDALLDLVVVALELVDEEGEVGEDALAPAIGVVLHHLVLSVRVQHPVDVQNGDERELVGLRRVVDLLRHCLVVGLRLRDDQIRGGQNRVDAMHQRK